MEHQIEFVGVDTMALYRRVYWHMSRRNRLINLAILGAATLWTAVLYGNTGRSTYLYLAIFYALMAAWYYLRPLRMAKKAYESYVKYNDGIMPLTTVCFGDQIVFQGQGGSSAANYDKIKKIHFVKEGLMMDMQEKRIHFSAIDQFTKGSMQELKQFLRQKRPDLKIPD